MDRGSRRLTWLSLALLAACGGDAELDLSRFTPAEAPDGGACGAACLADAAGPALDAAPVTPPDAGPLGSDAGLGPDAAQEGGDSDASPATTDSHRPEGVALCYTPLSREHAATKAFWASLRGGDLEARPAAITALTAAFEAHPDQEQFALLLGLAHLWRVAEPLPLESLDLLGLLDAVTASEEALERAYELCPTDHRITAWLAPIKIRMGRMNGDDARLAEGFEVLQRGIDHYPGFVLFSKFLVHADLPASDPDFLKAVEAVRDNTAYCGTVATGLSQDPACNNHPYASHNVEGASVFMGDMYAKAQEPETARQWYESAKQTGTYDSWDYQDLLEERLNTLDARVAGYATETTLDDFEGAWQSTFQCSVCHRD